MDIDLSGPPDLASLHSAVLKLVQGHQDHERRILESERVRSELQAQHAEFAASLGALGEQIELLHSGKLAAILSEQEATRSALTLKASTDDLEAVLSQQRSSAAVPLVPTTQRCAPPSPNSKARGSLPRRGVARSLTAAAAAERSESQQQLQELSSLGEILGGAAARDHGPLDAVAHACRARWRIPADLPRHGAGRRAAAVAAAARAARSAAWRGRIAAPAGGGRAPFAAAEAALTCSSREASPPRAPRAARPASACRLSAEGEARSAAAVAADCLSLGREESPCCQDAPA